MSNALETNKLSKRYGRTWALQDCTLSLPAGRVAALVGPNGAGKTTTLRILASMLRPTSGTVTVAGFDVVKQGREVRRRVGFLTGSTGLYDRLTPNEVVRYFAGLYGMGRGETERRREELFGQLGVHEFAGRRIGKLSTGMKQKVSIVRAVIHDPPVMIFDEPTGGLDVVTSRHIMDLIRGWRNAGKTIVFSTHRMGEAGLLSDDFAILDRGRLRYSGPYADFLGQMKAKSLEDEFIRIVQGT
jgi:sodium transport system ATP-binding protein